jgi:hypothetical protein
MLNSQFDYSKMFRLSDPLTNRPYRIAPQDSWIHEIEAWQLFRGELKPSISVNFVVRAGGMITDFLWSTFPPLLCVSKRVIDIFTLNNYTGWNYYPVRVYDRINIELPDYFGLSITSDGGERDLSRSKVITKPPIVLGAKPRRMYQGFYFNEQKCGCSDIFRIGGAFIIITDKVRKAMKHEHISNISFEPLPDIEMYVPNSKGNLNI